MSNSNARGSARKPRKPFKDFPLFPHATSRWCKKIHQRFRYFGPVTPGGDRGAMAALEEYQRQAADLHAGREPRPKVEGTAIGGLCDAFLNAKKARVESGELAQRSWGDYYKTCAAVVEAFGKARVVADLLPSDFDQLRARLAKRLGPVALRNEIGRARVLFKWGADAKLYPPVDYGQGFAKPSSKTLRKARRAAGVMMFEPAEIKAALRRADWTLKAFILLGANAGLGPMDLARLPHDVAERAVETGWLHYPRPKTEIDRRARLWGRTRVALRRALEKRPSAKDQADNGLAFLTKYGRPWVRVETSKKGRIIAKDSIAGKFRKVLMALGIKRGRLGLYGLRRGVQTVGEEVDPAATSYVMGHVGEAGDMAATYRQRIADHRLERLAEHLRLWLFSEPQAEGDQPRTIPFKTRAG